MTKKRIRTLLLFAVFAICAMVAPQTAFAAEHTTIDANNSQEFNNAVSTANAATSGEYVIRLTDNFNSNGASFTSTRPITILGNGKWGNLESSVQILGGTICGNHANDGAGVFASAYFFTAAYAICADTPSVTAAEKPGLFVENATISNNTANQDEGYGAGVLAVMLASPAKAEIRSCSITGNSGAVGAGVTSYGSFTNLVIDDCAITGNHATTHGGGFAAESNSGQNAGTVVTNTQLCNNTADKAASDIYLDNSPLKLQSAQDMDSFYQGKPDDVTGKKIDGWYTDDENLRYTEQTKEQRSEFTGYTNIAASGKTCLIAAANPNVDNPNKPDKGDGSGTDNPGDNKPDKDNQKPGTGDKEPGNKNDDQSNKDNADNNGGKNATNNGDAPNAENVIPATGDAASTLVIASLLIACCALAVAVIAKRKQSNL